MKKLLNREIKANSCYLIFFIITAIIVMMSPLFGLTGRPFCGGDSSVFKTIALQMQDGLLPYKDTFDHKGPLLYIIHYWSCFISPWYGICFFEYIFIVVTVIFWFKTAKLLFNNNNIAIASTAIGIWALIAFYIERNQSEEFIICFISISLFFFIKYFKTGYVGKIEIAVCGMCLSCIALIKFNVVVLFVPFLIGVLVDLIQKKKYKNIILYLGFYIIGILAIALPVLVWLLINNIFNDFVYCYILFNSKYAAYFANQDTIQGIVFYIINPFIFIPFMVILYKAFTARSIMWISYAFSFIFLFFVLNFGPHNLYQLIVLIPFIISPCGFLIKLIINKAEKKTFYVANGLIVLLILGGIVIAGVWLHKNGDMTFGYHDTEYEVANYVNDSTGEDDPLLVVGNDNIIYLLSSRKPASKYSYTAPIFDVSTELSQEYKNDVFERKPRLIIVNKYHINHLEDLIESLKNEKLLTYSETTTIGYYVIYELTNS